VSDDLGGDLPDITGHKLMVKLVITAGQAQDNNNITIEPSVFPLDLSNRQYFKASARVTSTADIKRKQQAQIQIVAQVIKATTTGDDADDPSGESELHIGPYLTFLGTRIDDSLSFLSCCTDVAISTATSNANVSVYRQFSWSLKPSPSANNDSVRRRNNSRLAVRLTEEFGEQLGTRLWDCSLLLAEYLSSSSLGLISRKRTKPLQKPSILELGAGVGLVSIVATLLNGSGGGGKVIATDIGQATMQLLTANTSQLEARIIECQPFDWNDLDAFSSTATSTGFDYVLAADVLYNPGSHTALLEALRWLCSRRAGHPHLPATQVLIAYKFRTEGEQEFFRRAQADYGFLIDMVYQQSAGHCIPEAMIYRLAI
jgi:predicted nicotinamide N-methyase